jgi:thioredoxin reductase (NADPH)
MSESRETGSIAPLPVLFLVDDDPVALDSLAQALVRRFGADYQVLKAVSPEAGLGVLEQMAADGAEVAVIAADLIMPGTGGVEFLERAHAMHPGACRALLVDMDNRGTRIPFGELGAIRRATSLRQIDFTVLKGWVTPEEWVYPQIQQALADWTKSNRPHHEVMKVVGEQWSPRSHALREMLGRNTVPFGFYATGTEAGSRLMTDHDVDPERLPAVILHDGSVLHDPEPGDIADALGVQTQPSSEVYDLAVLGAGPSGLAAAVYGASEGLNCLVIEPQAIGGQAGASSMIRNYLGFPRGLSGGELTFRAWEQALLFGAQFLFSHQAAGLSALVTSSRLSSAAATG